MIFVKDKIYAKVWKVEEHEKYIDLQITTSEKDADGNYVNSSWFPRAIGHAFNTLKGNLKEGDRLIITKSKLSNERYTAQDGKLKSSFRFVIFEADIEEQNNTDQTKTKPAPPAVSEPTGGDDSCPW